MASEEDLVWLSEQNIADHKDSAPPSGLEGMIGLADMVGSGHSVGGVVTDGMSMSGQVGCFFVNQLLLYTWQLIF